MPGRSMWEKMEMAQYGDLITSHSKSDFKTALDLVHSIHSIAIVEANETKLPPTIVQATKERKEPCWKRISNIFFQAFETGNVSFIRLMADVIERRMKPVDRLRDMIALQISGCEGFGQPLPTLKELQDILRGKGFRDDQIDLHQINRIVREDMERTLPEGKRGRPRKKK